MLDDAHTVISQELQAGEKLLWTGRPGLGIRLRASDAFLIPFSIFWCGFAILWEAMAIGMGAPVFFALFGIPFVVIGVYFVIGRFLVDASRRAHTYYGLTAGRVVIVSGTFTRKVKSLQLRTLTDISLQEKSDGSGTISFGPAHPFAQWFGSVRWPGMPNPPPEFEMIRQVRNVYEQLCRAQQEAP